MSVRYSATFSRHLNFVEWPLKAFRGSLFTETLPGYAFNLRTLYKFTDKDSCSIAAHENSEFFVLYGIIMPLLFFLLFWLGLP